MLKKLFLTILVMNLGAPVVWAQEEDVPDSELDIIEVELEKSVQKKSSEPVKSQTVQKDEVSFSGLSNLAPFTEVSVIQKRYLPKTNRVQFFGGLNWVTNNPFFDTYGLVGKAAWFLNETWAIEGTYISMNTTEAKATKELKDFQNVQTDNLVYPKSYLGADIMWLPIYGKFTWFNQKIIPFDMYFSAGYGTTGTQSDAKPGTMHLSTGQIFAITKGFALRWDFSWNIFSTKAVDETSATFNMLYLTVGASFFFPEAKYR